MCSELLIFVTTRLGRSAQITSRISESDTGHLPRAKILFHHFFHCIRPIQSIYFSEFCFGLVYIFLLHTESVALRFREALSCFRHDKFTGSAARGMKMRRAKLVAQTSKRMNLRNLYFHFLILVTSPTLVITLFRACLAKNTRTAKQGPGSMTSCDP
jgi:hypothetical protein